MVILLYFNWSVLPDETQFGALLHPPDAAGRQIYIIFAANNN
jgi:hypothetical protein